MKTSRSGDYVIFRGHCEKCGLANEVGIRKDLWDGNSQQVRTCIAIHCGGKVVCK